MRNCARVVTMVFLVVAAGSALARDTTVKGSVRKDGTYVSPHHRTTPNKTRTDNYSSKPNVNPYTGKRGTVDPYAPKPAQKR
jgi:hypothetical protein